MAQSGQAETTEDPGEPDSRKQYLVEVVAFQYHGPDSSAGEEFDRLTVERYLPARPFDIDEYNRIRETVSYTGIARLSGALEQLRANPQYTIMAKAAWIQPLLNRDEAIEVPLGQETPASTQTMESTSPGQGIAGPASGSPGVSGSVRVYGDYLLFVDVDLRALLPSRFRQDDQGFSGESGVSLNGSGSSFSSNRAEMFQISEKRRIKLDEFHYFDHPYMGAIVSVSRHEGAGDSAAAQ